MDMEFIFGPRSGSVIATETHSVATTNRWMKEANGLKYIEQKSACSHNCECEDGENKFRGMRNSSISLFYL